MVPYGSRSGTTAGSLNTGFPSAALVDNHALRFTLYTPQISVQTTGATLVRRPHCQRLIHVPLRHSPAQRSHHRRLRLRRRRGHPGRSQDLRGARRARPVRDYRADRAAHARRDGRARAAGGFPARADRRLLRRFSHRCGQAGHARQHGSDRPRSPMRSSITGPPLSCSTRSWWRPAARACSKPDALDALRARLLPLATILTPNIPEAELLLGRPIDDDAAAEAAWTNCGRWVRKPCCSRAGHLQGPAQMVDRYYDGQKSWPSSPTSESTSRGMAPAARSPRRSRRICAWA